MQKQTAILLRTVRTVEVTGKILDFSLDFVTGKPKITLELNEKQEATQGYDEFKNCEKLSIKISKYRKKRSLDANAYCWVLCTKLAEKLSDDKVKYTKEDIYRNAVQELGIYKDFPNLNPSDAKTLRHAWELLGTGWITEQVDFMQDGENVVIRCYYGSSTYNTKQMSRLIDNLVQDCEAVGIPTQTPEQIANMLSLWKAGENNGR